MHSDDDRLTVYRATGGHEPDGGSWTLDVAERMARIIASGRGRFLGYYSATPVVWRGAIQVELVLGYFADRDEAEVVLPHGVASIEASYVPGGDDEGEQEDGDVRWGALYGRAPVARQSAFESTGFSRTRPDWRIGR